MSINKQHAQKFNAIIKELTNARAQEGKATKRKQGVADSLAQVFRSGTEREEYLEWFTQQVESRAIKPEDVKAVQQVVNKKATQEKMFSIGEGDKLTKRVRLMRGNKTLLTLGLCKQSDIDNKAYMWIVDDLGEKVEKTPTEVLQKFVKDYNLKDANAVIALLGEVEFN